MIAFLAGTIAHKSSDRLYLEVRGVGYELLASTRTLSMIGSTGEDLLLYTHLHVRENEVSLFGFIDEEEKRVFLALIDVSGIGPKVALAVLSSLQPQMLAGAVATEDVALLSSVPGIGKKTAQRLIIELKGKIERVFPTFVGAAGSDGAGGGNSAAATAAGSEHSAFADAQAALFSMGFSAAEIAEAFAGAAADADSETLLKYALAKMGGKA
ncbi:MAG: Holliday junction branch migration protein RuvA [Coriobacteriia bacterium]|nr:Holliday junction branch migration protein RuvA [Coriobacteriia bacterium]